MRSTFPPAVNRSTPDAKEEGSAPGGLQPRNQFGVGGRERIAVEFARAYPSKICDIERLGAAIQNGAVEEVEPDGFRRIVVLDRKELVIDPYFYSEFLEDFAFQRDFQRFSGFDLPARELPQPGKVGVV